MENVDGLGGFGTPQDIGVPFDGVSCGRMDVADFDGDGDPDIGAADTVMRWYDNTDGLGTFAASGALGELDARSFVAADFDGDGDPDLMTEAPLVNGFAHYEDALAWYPNPGTDPLNPDSDGDGLTDGAEVLTYLTDPGTADSDADGVNDGNEIAAGTDPLDLLSVPRLSFGVPAISGIGAVLLACLVAALARTRRLRAA